MRLYNTLYGVLLAALLLLSAYTEANAQNTYAAFYDAPKESYVKSMKTVFSDIHNRKWEKAQKDYTRLEEKSASQTSGYTNTQMQALFPLPQVAMAILLSTENTGVPSMTVDYNKAYSLLKQALAYPQQDKLNAFLFDTDVNVNLSMQEDRIENELCARATKENTEKAYDAVIDSLYPQSLRLQAMKQQREDLVFSLIRKAPTEAECSRFLEKYPDALESHRTIISNELDSIRYSALDGSVASLEEYIKKYPNSSYIQTAQDTLETIEYRNIQNTAASCRAFLKKYPSSKYTMDVTRRLTDLSYKEALKSGTATAYQQFCKDFPYDLRYQNIFDTLLTRMIKEVYDTVLAGGEPNIEKYLSNAFCTSVENRNAAEQKMISDGLVPPRRRNIWTGLSQQGIESYIKQAQQPASSDSVASWTLDIKDINLKSKTAASVEVILNYVPSGNASAAQQIDNCLDFIFEGAALKIDDIRLDKGATSQKNGGM